MKNKIVILVSMVGVLSAMAAPVLENDAMRILFADASRGWGVTGIVNKVAGDVRFLRDTTREIDLWQVFFAKEKDGKRVECKEVSNRSPAKRRIERDGNRTTFVFEGIDLPGEPGAVDVRATVELEPGMSGSLWTLKVTNRSRVFALTRTKYPVLKRVTDDGAGDVMMPSVNFGAFIQRKRDSKKIPDPRMVGYMGYSPMVSAFNLGDAGLYVAAHDGKGHTKYFDLKGEQNVSGARRRKPRLSRLHRLLQGRLVAGGEAVPEVRTPPGVDREGADLPPHRLPEDDERDPSLDQHPRRLDRRH